MTTQTTPFMEMLSLIIERTDISQKQMAKGISISPQYLCDLLQGKRGPHPELVNKICDFMGRGPKGRLEWHTAGAKSVGWEI